VTDADVTCPHRDKPWRCVTCCLAALRRDLPRLERAVTVRLDGAERADYVRGGMPSWELINLNARALIQDIERAGGLDQIEAKLNTYRDPDALADLRRHVRQWRSRAALILADVLAPVPLMWDAEVDGTIKTIPVLCPVVSDQGDCHGSLRYHRDDDPNSDYYERRAIIRCARDDDHEWHIRHGGWLRLGVLLGGTMGGAA
jgi:hypothetical protein